MNPQVPSEDGAAWATRLGETIAWLFYESRRPGLLGASKAIKGKTANGTRATLVKSGSQWTFHINGVEIATYEDVAKAIEVIPQHGFVPETVVVVPAVTDQLYQGAVEQAEAALNKYLQSVAIAIRSDLESARKLLPPPMLERFLKVPIADPFDFVMSTAFLDQALRHGMASIALAISAGESQVNEWVETLGSWESGEDNESLVKKMKVLARKAGADLDIGRNPFQSLQRSVDFRHELIHPQPIEKEFELGTAAGPGRDMSIQARSACLHVRECLIEVAGVLHIRPPAYLRYCPPCQPDDDEAWENAVVLTGVRPDPDFDEADLQ